MQISVAKCLVLPAASLRDRGLYMKMVICLGLGSKKTYICMFIYCSAPRVQAFLSLELDGVVYMWYNIKINTIVGPADIVLPDYKATY